MAEFAIYLGEAVFAAGIVLLLTLRILRTRGLDRRIYVPVHIASIFGGVTLVSLAGLSIAFEFSNFSLEFYPVSWGELAFLRGLCVALIMIPVMLLLANIGRRLLKLRIAGMVAEINLARTPEGIQTVLRRALADPSLAIYLWSQEHHQYVDADGRSLDGDNSSHRVVVDVPNPDGSASARIVAEESVVHHPELLRAAQEAGGAKGKRPATRCVLHGRQVDWRCTIQRCKPTFRRQSNESGALVSLVRRCRTSCRLVWPIA